ncbi:MAG TPA: Fe-S protein assembly chaperone HscA [Chitinophagaceae bacterium]|nr:Fe-S protein assembly chaperone HscA [Chitinophagaceae bacterium]HNF29590.1 Fe-S protein assembly chaperone HscA [Chitinophagaceae bacterium]HNJ57932.1 Fe-S protein assembly chaperone HscA [Chitinophagaceae bacterium]HNM33639.1 Fe-S protein assembly chaperone HscA [Chitinophagaceae bacterium]
MSKISINIATGSLQQAEIVVGIDLGTTNSLIAVIHPESKQAVALKEHDSSSLVPSVIYFDELNNAIVGDNAKQFLEKTPERTIFSSKRLMGKSYNDIKENEFFFSYKVIDDDTDRLVKVQVGDKFYSPVELSSYILKELKARAEHILKTSVNKVVITVPAYFNDAQRQATRDAGKLAGLDVLRIINEPTAASLAYGIGINQTEEKTIAVYDLGGGTFDVSILTISNGIFEVLSTHGNTYLGGDDFDKVIVDYWSKEFNFSKDELQQNKQLMQGLRIKAEEAKKHLSHNAEYRTNFNGDILTINKDKFEQLIQPFVNKTLDSCKQALKDSNITINEIDEVVMVGGSTRVPLVTNAVSNFFNKKVNNTLNPDEVVALGAAIQADILAGNNKEILLLDITPLSLGIETMGGLMDVLMPRNSKIPSKAARQYTTSKDGQINMRISVYQGERDLVKDNRKLAEFNLTNIPAMPAGLPKVEVSFLIDADGILKVKAKELRSGVEQTIDVKPQYGLTDDEVEKMLMDSITHAKDDIAIRALTEARTEGEQLLETTEKFIGKNAAQLSQDEMLATAQAMQTLQLALTMNDKNLIQTKIEELNEISRPYAERIMDNAVSSAMKGKVI